MYWWRPGERLNNPIVDLWPLVFFQYVDDMFNL
jgi:hypothetical protein